MSSEKLCSVVMPVWNTQYEFLCESIQSLLVQTYKPIEIIVVFDGLGAPEYSRFLQEYATLGIQTFQISHVGIAGALNFGISKARGRFIARADADDLSEPSRIATQVLKLQQSCASICGSALRYRYVQGSTIGTDARTFIKTFPADDIAIKLACCRENAIPHPAVCIDRKMLSQPLIYTTSERHEDYELWSRLASTETFVNIPAPLVVYRIHSGQYTKRTRYGFMLKSRLRFILSLPLYLRPAGLVLATLGVINGLASRILH